MWIGAMDPTTQCDSGLVQGILWPNGPVERCCGSYSPMGRLIRVPWDANEMERLETMTPCIVGHSVTWNVMLRGTFDHGFFQHLGHCYGTFYHITFHTGTFCSSINITDHDRVRFLCCSNAWYSWFIFSEKTLMQNMVWCQALIIMIYIHDYSP